MEKVKTQKDRDYLKEYFHVVLYDTLLDAAFLGYHGRILVDNIKKPSILFVDVGHTYYYYGDAFGKEAKLFASLVEDYAEIHASDDWVKRIKEAYPDKVHHITRYEMDDSSISLSKLEEIVNNKDEDLIIKQIDEELYHTLIKQDWTSSMVENFTSVEDFMEHGFGFVLLNKNGDILSGTSSFARYSQGYEVEVQTHISHRRKGYALLISAYFIKETMKQGKHAHWDAQNIHSKRLAEKLGYTLKRTYHIIEV